MKAVRKTMLVVVSIVGLLLLLVIIMAAFQPADFSITRTASISGPPESVFPHVNELRKWEAWSPWAKIDPTMKQTYEGPAAGEGSKSHWVGNGKVGEGRMTIVQSKPSESLRIKLEFIRPFKAENGVLFKFETRGNETLVTWRMDGKKNFMSKLMGLLMNIDKMVGGQFETGLAQLKAVVEANGSGK